MRSARTEHHLVTPTRRRSRLQQPGAGLWVGGFLAACLPLVYIAADLVGAR